MVRGYEHNSPSSRNPATNFTASAAGAIKSTVKLRLWRAVWRRTSDFYGVDGQPYRMDHEPIADLDVGFLDRLARARTCCVPSKPILALFFKGWFNGHGSI
jgi:hypothetical protein